MAKLAFEDVGDVNAPHPYILVYLLADHESFWPGQFEAFMELAVEKDQRLVLTVYKSDAPVSLSVDQWDEISRVAREYHEETLKSGDDW